jgi:DNA-binding CsgD family transcriptional regulator
MPSSCRFYKLRQKIWLYKKNPRTRNRRRQSSQMAVIKRSDGNTTVLVPSVPVPKSCARCGRRYEGVGGQYICPNCRGGCLGVANRQLSFRERQIVSLIRQAKANKEIAYELRLTEGTVKDYLHNIFRKLGVKNRTELALRRDSDLTYSSAPRWDN